MTKANKLASNFEHDAYKVVSRTGSEVVVMSTVTGKSYRRNVSHLQRISCTSDSATTQHNDSQNSTTLATATDPAMNDTRPPENDTASDPPKLRRSARRQGYLKDSVA